MPDPRRARRLLLRRRRERLRRELPTCPACTRPLGRRCRRRAVELVLGLVAVFPFRCMGCGYRFLSFRPGARRPPRSALRRAVDRVPVSIPCDITTQDGVIAGNFIEVSLQGGAVDTHPTPAPGTEVSVVLHARTVGRPVRITSAVVRWSRLGRFGLLFQTISPEDAERLRQVVLTARGYSPELAQAKPARRRGGGAPWIVIAAVSAAILATLLFSLRP